MKTIWFKTSLALTISAVSTYTLANGIAINEQSASGAGTAYAGRASPRPRSMPAPSTATRPACPS